MPRYGLVWLEIAREHYASLPATACKQIDARIEQLRENSRQQPRSAYGEATDQWTITYGGGAVGDRLRRGPRAPAADHPAAGVARTETPNALAGSVQLVGARAVVLLRP